jgi:aminopeptidase N
LRPTFDQLGWNPKTGETARQVTLRADLINALGDLNDKDIISGCRERFHKFLDDPASIPPDLRPSIFNVVGRYADEATWEKIHELGTHTASIEEKQIYYNALTQTVDPGLAKRALQIALTEELPTSRAVSMVPRVARQSEHPDIAWDFARTHMKQLLEKADALTALRYAPCLFSFFSGPSRIQELETYAKTSLPPDSAKFVTEAVDEIGFRSGFRQQLLPQLTTQLTPSRSNANTSISPKSAPARPVR